MEHYDPDLYFNWIEPKETPIDYFPIPNSDQEWEKRRQRWQNERWLGDPEVVADDWLFEPLPSSQYDEF